MAPSVSKLPPLLPAPRRVEARAGAFRLHDDVPIVLAPGSDERDLESARSLARRAARLGRRLPVETHARTGDLGPRIELRREGESGDAYHLEVGDAAVVVTGAGGAGLRYGAETLGQLLAPRIPACRIEDAPDLGLRGLMLDVSRGKVPRLETLERVVDACAALKLNVLMLYTEHTFHFRRHPEIGAGASPLDAETLRELDRYAALHHVDLVPTLQSLGHMARVLSLDRYRDLDESGRGWTLSPAEPGTYALLRDLYDEYLPNFRSPWFNANCDEPWDLGTGKSRKRAERIGRAGVYLEHVCRVRELAARHGKRTMIWGDVVHESPERVAEIDRDLVLLDWWYEDQLDFDRVAVFAENGIEFLVCPGTDSWNCLFPRLGVSERNVARWAAAGKRHGALGLLCTDWGDGGHYNLLGNSWFGYAWAAQQAWSGDVPADRFDRAFGRVLFGEESGRAARAYRDLGGVHDAGFRVFNASPLQLLFFDDLDRAYFVQGSRPGALRRAARRLGSARRRLEAARAAFGDDALTHEELRYAADASLLAVRKALAGLDWVAWRRGRAQLDGRGRRRLAGELDGLASAQRDLGRRLRALWLARSQPSEFGISRRRLDVSVASLRRASRALLRGEPPPPPPVPADFGPGAVVAAVRASLALPRR
jgi:hexosaminidase